jgi:hypothetical protein
MIVRRNNLFGAGMAKVAADRRAEKSADRPAKCTLQHRF